MIAEPHYLILEYVMYGKLLAYLRDHRTRQYFYNFSEDSAALTSRDLTVFGYCVARGMEYLASKKVRDSGVIKSHLHHRVARFSPRQGRRQGERRRGRGQLRHPQRV